MNLEESNNKCRVLHRNISFYNHILVVEQVHLADPKGSKSTNQHKFIQNYCDLRTIGKN